METPSYLCGKIKFIAGSPALISIVPLNTTVLETKGTTQDVSRSEGWGSLLGSRRPQKITNNLYQFEKNITGVRTVYTED